MAFSRLSRAFRALSTYSTRASSSGSTAFRGPADEQLRSFQSSSLHESSSSSSTSVSRGLADEQLRTVSDPNLCYIVTAHGISAFPAERFIPVETFVQYNPIFDHVPSDRLVVSIDSNKPYRTAEKSRKWIRSGYIVPYLCNMQDLCLLNPFLVGNVGVLDGLDVLCFKELNLVDNEDPTPLHPTSLVRNSSFSTFFTSLVFEEYGDVSVIPKGLKAAMVAADSGNLRSDIELIYQPEFMSDELLSTFFMEYQRLVRKQLPTRGGDNVSKRIMKYVDQRMGFPVSDVVVNHDLLKQWCKWSWHWISGADT